MNLKDFFALVQYANTAWRGYFSRAEMIEMLALYYKEYRLSVMHKQLSYNLSALCDSLLKDGSKQALEWRNRILQAAK